ncbi:hypothetical protein EDB87DRAFT_1582070 [Lactarius vividus]|nr:hypothetical protein EDB87DRAFT_1582070 [Lactarius vividus]
MQSSQRILLLKLSSLDIQPHTSSPSLLAVAHAVANLMATNFGGSGLDQVLSAHLNSISPQAKQVIIPALLGMAKFTEMHTQARSGTQPQTVIEPLGSNSSVASATSSGVHMLAIKCIGDHSAPVLGAATLFGTPLGLIRAFSHHPIGCSALVDNGKAFPEMQNVPSTMTGSFPFVAMGNQAGLCEQQSAQWKLEGRRERSHN